MDKDTERLIRGLQKQQSKAQQQALSLYGRSAFSIIVRMTHSQEDAEEIYQDAFVKVFSRIDTFNPNEASIATWIGRIAYNEAVSFMRRKHDNIVYMDDQNFDFKGITDNMMDEAFDCCDNQTVRLIEHALDFIPPSEKAIITMFYFDDMSIRDIAFITESTSTAVAQRLSRTRKKLYHIIKTLQHDDN